MEELSNNVLAGLFFVAIVITGIGIISLYTYEPSLTGFATTDTGYANVTIESQASLTLLLDLTDFGDGTPNSGTALNISTHTVNANGFNNGSFGNGTVASNTDGVGTDTEGDGFAVAMVVENNGNQNIDVNLQSNATADQFIGGDTQARLFMYMALNNESSSCTAGGDLGDWRDMNTAQENLCSVMDDAEAANTVQAHFLLQIPNNAAGGKRALITFTAS